MRGAALALFLVTTGLSAQSALPGTRNYVRLDATVACAGATTVDAIPAIKAEGFNAIVNLRLASEQGAEVEASKAAAEAVGVRYIHIPFNGAEPSTAAVDDFVAALRDPANSPVYVHCGSGGRAAMMWFIKRVMVDGWSVDKASEEATRAGLTNPKLKAFALEYLKAHGKA